MRPHIVVIPALVMGLGGSPALADWKWFVPKPWSNGAYFDLFGSHERDDFRTTTGSFGYTDFFLKEKLTVYSDGYFYHPRFLQYHAALGGALKQEDYRAEGIEPPGWRHGTGVEYDARLFLLPEHPYNLEIFALRYEPLYKELAATQHGSVETSRGAYLQYRRQPYLFHGKYIHETTDSTIYSTEVSRLGVDGEYLKKYDNGNQLSVNGAYNPSRFHTSLGLDGDQTEALLGSFVDLRRLRIDASLTGNRLDQEDASGGSLHSDLFSSYGRVTAYFPWNLRGHVTYRWHDNQSTFPALTPTGERTLSDISRDAQVDLIHRLYRSLDTTYTFLDNRRESSGGDTDTRFHTLNFNYTKLIPPGRLQAGLNFGNGRIDNHGGDVVDEPHLNISVPGGFFTLGQQNVEPGTIVITAKARVLPYNIAVLTETAHYALTAIGNTFQVTITDLPAPLTIPGDYDFFASYSLMNDEFELRSHTYGFNTSVDLFDTMLTPYYSYAATRSDVLSGVFPGVPLDSTVNTAGVRYQHGPLRARGEYQRFDWEVSPYRAWRGEVQYVGALSPTTSVYGTAAYINKYYPDGSSVQLAEAYTDETVSASGSIRKEIPSQNLSISGGATLSQLMGPVDTRAYSANAALSWKIGRLILTTGATAYSTQTRGTAIYENDRTHTYYYVNLRRILF